MKLKKQFSDFYSDIKIDSESNVLRQKRSTLEGEIKDKLPGIFEKHEISLNKSDIRMIYQGSYKYQTTIKSDIVDSDVAVIIPIDTSENPDPRKIKGYLKDSIDIPVRTVSIKEPCVRASYYENSKEWLHIDLPLYAQDGNNVYLARGKQNSSDYSWETADPDGLNDYLCDQINGNNQLRKIICFIKKWRNEKYSNASSDHSVPPSIGLTLLACDCFVEAKENGEDYDLLALQKTLNAIKNKFYVTKDSNGLVTYASVSRYLPVTPYTDVFKKMKDSSSSYMITFYNRLCTAIDNLINAINVSSEHDAAEYVQKVLGDEFTVPPKAVTAATTSAKREHSFG